MKLNIIICMFIQLIFTINLGSSFDLKLLSSSSPVGPYRLVFKQFHNCNPTENNKMQFNMYMSHRENKTMLFGNASGTIPFDDNLFLEMKMAIKDSSGIWKENVYMHNSPKACSTVKHLIGKAWLGMVRGYGFTNFDCPILPGFYKSPGMDLSIFENANFPKLFIYGTYKLYIYYTLQNEIVGCQAFVFDAKRP